MWQQILEKNKRGFTLIELLVVIAIIGLLSTLSILALNTARARARDAKRVSDVKQIQTALEMYFNDAGLYPSAVAAGSSIAYNNGSATSTYLQSVPTPPTPLDYTTGACAAQPAYTYTANGSPSRSSYTLQYCLGAQTGGVTSGAHTATPAGIQ